MKQVEHRKSIVFVLILAIMAVLFSSLFPTKAKASSYSSGGEKSISINKKLREVGDDEYQDNIAASENVFYEGDLIEFKITVENTGDGVLKNVKVTDYLPPFLKLIFYPGDFDVTNNKVVWTIDEINAGESKDYLIRAKISQSQYINTLTKETNVAQVCVDERCDKDNAIYYIGNGVYIPNTGVDGLIIKTVVVLTLIGSGIVVRKSIRGY